MNTRKLRKAILTLCSALLLMSLSVGITVAYLTDTEAVTNTFTVGKIYIELDEADVDAETDTDSSDTYYDDTDKETKAATQNHEKRDRANKYHLIPNATLGKDPIVWVEEGSEDAWLFIKVKNEIAGVEENFDGDNAQEPTIDQQILGQGWTEVTGVTLGTDEKLYVKNFVKATAGTPANIDYAFPTFTTIFIEDTLNSDDLVAYADKTVVVNAYAIQANVSDTAAGAWTVLNQQLATENN